MIVRFSSIESVARDVLEVIHILARRNRRLSLGSAAVLSGIPFVNLEKLQNTKNSFNKNNLKSIQDRFSYFHVHSFEFKWIRWSLKNNVFFQ